MAIQDLKFKESDFVGKDVSSLPDQIEGQAEFIKARIDNVPKNMIALGRFNDLVDEVGNRASKSGDTFTGDVFFDNAGIFPTQTGQGLIGSTTYKWDGIYANRINAYEGLACLGTLTLDKTQAAPVSTLTYIANHVYRFGTWVFVDIACRHAENGIPSSGAIGTLPAGYRPPAGLDCAMGIAAKADGSIYLVHIIVQTNGVIYVVDQTGSGPYKWVKAFLTLSTV